MKKIFLWDWWIQGWSQLGFEWEIEAKGKRKVTFLSFFSLFTFLGYPPLKIFKSKLQPLHPPSHHNHPTTVLPTRHPTWWWCFDCDRMSSIRMISYHGNQNYLPSPTSKTSCDRYTQPPKIKTHTTMLPKWCPPRPYEYHGYWSRFPNRSNKFSLSKKTSKTMEEGGPSFGKNFSEMCRSRDCFF